MSKHCVLTVAPLSKRFLSDISNKMGVSLEVVFVGDLRQMGLWALFCYLRRLDLLSLFVAAEDSESLALLPAMSLLAALTKSKKRYVVRPNGSVEKLGIADIAYSAAGFIGLSLYFQFMKGRVQRQFNHLKKTTQPVNVCKSGKRILYLNANLWFSINAGGAVGHIAGVVNALADKGYDVTYAALGDNAEIKPGIKRLKLPSMKLFGYPSELNYYRFSDLVTATLAEWVEKNKPDFIYQRMSIANTSGARLSQKYHIPLIIEYNGSEVWCAEKWGQGLQYAELARQAEHINLTTATQLITISQVLQEELEDLGVPAERIVAYPNCIDPQKLNPKNFSLADCDALRARYGIKQDAVLLTFIGTFGKWHGMEVLVSVISTLVHEYTDWLQQQKVHFMLVGDGPQMSVVREVLDEACMPFVTITGRVPQDQGPLYLAASNILLSPHVPNSDGSRFFGSPTKLFEYMAMGKGIIASDLDQIGEVLAGSLRVGAIDSAHSKDRAPAILCQPGDESELLSSICYLVEHPELCALMGENARKKALAQYTWQHHVDAIMSGFFAHAA